MRGGAIIAVLFAHGRALMPVPDDYLFLTITGKFSVELFFVLSGFLIGSILIKTCEREISVPSLFNFWMRRWLRTLPAYFAVLLFVWAFYGMVSPYYFVFLQDLMLHNWDILPVSWTLVIEEWFYLLFPPACFLLMLFFRMRGFLIATILLLIFSMAVLHSDYYTCAADASPLRCFENEIRKFTFRFTSLGLGTLMAYIHRYRNLREWLRPHLNLLKWLTAAVCAVVMLFCADVILRYPGSLPLPLSFMLFYPLMGIGSVFITTLLYVWEPKPHKWVGNFFTYASVTSYSCYLWHMMLLEETRLNLSSWNPYLSFLLFFTASLLVGGISYRLIEKPFLNLRDRYTQHLIHKAQAKHAKRAAQPG